MKLFLAMEYTHSLMEGTSETLIGVFSTPKLAELALKKSTGSLHRAEVIVPGKEWRYVFDGELTLIYKIIENELDKPRY